MDAPRETRRRGRGRPSSAASRGSKRGRPADEPPQSDSGGEPGGSDHGGSAAPGFALRWPHWDPVLVRALEAEAAAEVPRPHARAVWPSVGGPAREAARLEAGGEVAALAVSPRGEVLAACMRGGGVRLWRVGGDWALLAELRDVDDTCAEEPRALSFSLDERRLFVAGMRRRRDRWDDAADDNALAPCPIKSYALGAARVAARFWAHRAAVGVLCALRFRRSCYLLSADDHGRLIKWALDSSWDAVLYYVELAAPQTRDPVADVAVLPGCGGRYFVAAAGSVLGLYDLETETLLQTFSSGLPATCGALRASMPILGREHERLLLVYGWACAPSSQISRRDEQASHGSAVAAPGADCIGGSLETAVESSETFAVLRLVLPAEYVVAVDAFAIEEVLRCTSCHRVGNELALRRSSCRVTALRNVVAVASDAGAVLLLDVRTGECVDRIATHSPISAVRAVELHPHFPLLFTGGGDGCIAVFELEQHWPSVDGLN
jgi:WD40 repeat protein